MMRKFLIAASVTLPLSALAQPPQAVGTNFPVLKDYPRPSCTKPGSPPKRPSVTSAMEVDRYNAILAVYNKMAHEYVLCVNAYVRNADNDSDLIRRRSRDAVDEANAQSP